MMQAKRNSIWFCFMVVSLLAANSLFSQSNKEIDSIIKIASQEIYANPDKVIQNGENILKKPGLDIDYKIKVNRLISDGYSAKRDYEKSLQYVIRANDLLRFSQDKLLKIAITNKMGIQYHQLKIYDKALQFLDQAEQLIAEYPVKDSVRTESGRNYIVRGFIYKEKLSCAIAIAFFDRGIAEFKKSNFKADNARISIAEYNKGNCYLLLSNNKLARENFVKAIESAKVVDAKSLQAFALKGLARVNTREGDYLAAIQALKEALNISAEVQDLVLNLELYNGLSENYLDINNLEQFKFYQQKYSITQKMLKENERVSASESLGVKEAEFKSKVVDLDSEFYYALLVLFFLSILIVLFFYVLIKRKRKELGAIKSQIALLQNKKVQ
ncbi:tetratricopeptide repeat protein [Flavobacterium sp. XGLA_31]|uniref:tetratricopeptide repeat protein n=1 Tax=Flavobacterium sp. XGLA_31 TaxID=3447666 RepID=UPI003F38124C